LIESFRQFEEGLDGTLECFITPSDDSWGRAASLAARDAYAESDLDNPAPEDFRTFCPTTGDMFTLIATHPMMHAGQFVIVRRQLGKPILM
jgi:hypothetical protein